MSGQKPSLGRIVLVPVIPTLNNGESTAPAVITRVWSDDMVNVRVFGDCSPGANEWKTSLKRVDELPEHEDGTVPAHVWCWPPRV